MNDHLHIHLTITANFMNVWVVYIHTPGVSLEFMNLRALDA